MFEWPEVISSSEEIEREICKRGSHSNWLVACERVLAENEALLEQNQRFSEQLCAARKWRNFLILAVGWLMVFCGIILIK